ncbi:hypothetical protein [Flavobacterium sp.]|uniref:RipA family octameric membrane protein n=1 Tax=Flavobacterium sp. TaxID=239 RepID=UPI002625B015|nr:hypothetical protein [Flavobacterium sp.]
MKFIFQFFEKVWSYFYTPDKDDLQLLSEEEYKEIFIKGRSKADIQLTYEKAWQAKNFEIELYWKRASYFWAFQIAAFAGYFSVHSSKTYQDRVSPQTLFFVVCIGFVTALAWRFTNKGSKSWQRHWEIHVDMLENEITGPLYKIITSPKTFSVSKINEIVSHFTVMIWVILGAKYFADHLCIGSNCGEISFQIIFSMLGVVYFSGAMILGHGRGRFGNRQVKFYKRKFTINR